MKNLWVMCSLFLIVWGLNAHAAPVDLVVTDLDGRQQSIMDYRGKWVVVNYWATWCPPCLEELPDLVHFHESHKDRDAVVLGMNMEDIERQRLQAFVEDNYVTYPVIPMLDDTPVVGEVPGLPTTYLISPSGELVAGQTGMVTSEAIEAFMAEHSKNK